VVDGIKTHLGINDFKDTIYDITHPAGFKMFGDVMLEDIQDIPMSLYNNIKGGSGLSYTLIKEFILDVGNVFTDFDPNEWRKEVMVLIEKYELMFRNQNMDETMDGYAFKYHMLTRFYELQESLQAWQVSHGFTSVERYLEQQTAKIIGHWNEPSWLETNKYNIRPGEGFTPFDDAWVTATYGSLYPETVYHSETNLSSFNPELENYTNYGNTRINTYDAAVFADFTYGEWSSEFLKKIMPDSHTIVARI
jgi:hypothetical protein